MLATDEAASDETRALARTIAEAEGRAEKLLAAARQIAAARAPDHHGLSRVQELELVAPTGVDLAIKGDSVLLPMSAEGVGIILSHLIANAASAGASRVAVIAKADDEGAVLTVNDNGGGISEGNVSRIFDPFFTTNREKGGTGMGLAIVQALLLAHGGQIAYLPTESGACFEVRF